MAVLGRRDTVLGRRDTVLGRRDSGPVPRHTCRRDDAEPAWLLLPDLPNTTAHVWRVTVLVGGVLGVAVVVRALVVVVLLLLAVTVPRSRCPTTATVSALWSVVRR